jgi:hypothetical protein
MESISSPKELDAHRVRRSGREDVKDAAAHREFAAIHHQVDACIGVLDQSACGLVKRQVPALLENQRLHVAKAGHHWLDQRTHRHHEYLNRPEHDRCRAADASTGA